MLRGVKPIFFGWLSISFLNLPHLSAGHFMELSSSSRMERMQRRRSSSSVSPLLLDLHIFSFLLLFTLKVSTLLMRLPCYIYKNTFWFSQCAEWQALSVPPSSPYTVDINTDINSVPRLSDSTWLDFFVCFLVQGKRCVLEGNQTLVWPVDCTHRGLLVIY